MKFAAIVGYDPDKERLRNVRATFRKYLRRFLNGEQLRTPGPFAENAGAQWVVNVVGAEETRAIVDADSLVEAGVIVGWTVRLLSFWSAQEAKIER